MVVHEKDGQPTFRPWRGTLYGDRSRFGVGVLALGESHYGSDWDTIRMVQRYQEYPTGRFMTGTATILVGVPYARDLQRRERNEIWHHIALYNYFQSFVGETSRVPPKGHQWNEGEAPFRHVLSELRPDVILVLSKRLRGHLEQTEPKLADLEMCWGRHPSGRGWSADAKRKIIRDFEDVVRRARARRPAHGEGE